MQPHNIVSREEWIAARKAHLAHEKEYTSARDRLSEERRALPWVKVDKDYRVRRARTARWTLADLFRRPQPACGAAFHVRARLERRPARAARSGPTGSSA